MLSLVLEEVGRMDLPPAVHVGCPVVLVKEFVRQDTWRRSAGMVMHFHAVRHSPMGSRSGQVRPKRAPLLGKGVLIVDGRLQLALEEGDEALACTMPEHRHLLVAGFDALG